MVKAAIFYCELCPRAFFGGAYFQVFTKRKQLDDHVRTAHFLPSPTSDKGQISRHGLG